MTTAEFTPLGDRSSPLERQHRHAIPPLQVADLIFVRHKGNFTRWLLRRLHRSYWDHVALVLFVKDEERGHRSTVIIESIQPGINSALLRGVEMHRLEKYLNHPNRYDIGIKRMKSLSEEVRERVRSYMLINLDAPYYPMSTTKFILANVFPYFRRRVLSRHRYSCSSLIQKAFYESVDWAERPSVLFRGPGYSPIEIQELTSPRDIEMSPLSEWIWNAP